MKRQWKRWLSLVLVLVMLISAAPIQVNAVPLHEGTCGENVNWRLQLGVLSIYGEGAMDDYTYSANATNAPWFEYADEITEVYIDDGVTYIGAHAFGCCKGITDVTIGADVETIGESAFYFTTGLQSVTIPGTVKTIGDGAFHYSGLASVTLQEGIETIEDYAFNGTELTSVVLPDSVTTLGKSVFDSCTDLEEVTLSNKLTTIQDRTFESCSSLKCIVIPSGVQTIEESVFYCCAALQSIAIPASVERIDYNSFSDCYSLTDVYFGGTQEAWEDMYVDCDAKYVHYDVADPTGHWTSVVTPATCTKDGGTTYTCACATPYTYTDILKAPGHQKDENNVCTVCGVMEEGQCGAEADTVFWNLTGDGKLTIFGNGAMADYNYNFSANATTAPWSAYADAITSVVIEEGVTYIGVYAFAGCKSITDVTIGADVETIGESAFYMTKGLKNVTIPGTVKTISDSAFNISALTSVTLQEGIEVIGTNAFRQTKLTSVALPDSVTTLGGLAFWECGSLTEVTLSAKLTTIPEYVFYGCHKLQSVTIPSGVKTIEDSAFCGCAALQSIAIPASVESIGINAFSDCYNLTDVYFGGTQEAWVDMEISCGADYIHYDVADPTGHWTSVVTPATCTKDGGTTYTCACATPYTYTDILTAPGHQKDENNVCTVCGVMEEGQCGAEADTVFWNLTGDGKLTIFGNGAMADYNYNFSADATTAPWFEYADEITEVFIDDGVTYIGALAFGCCKSITDVTIGADVETIGEHAFYMTQGLKNVTVPGTVKTIGNGAFSLSSLVSVTLQEGIEVIETNAFRETKLTSVALPDSVITLGERALYYCRALEEVTLSAKLTTIPEQVFYGCSKLQRVTIPSGVKTIEDSAFSYCAALQSIAIPASVERTGYNSFSACYNLTDVYFGGTKEAWEDLDVDCEADYIHYDVADPTGHWTSVVTPMTCTQDGITTHSCACAVPYTYTSDRIPAQHTYDDENDKICNVCNLWVEGECGAEDDTVFWKLTGDGKLTIFGNGAMDDYTFSARATDAPWFEYADEITEVFIDEGVTYIGANAFGCCESITDVTIGKDVKTIGEAAFFYATGLQSVTIPGTVKTIGVDAFLSSGLTSITLQEGIEVIEKDAFRSSDLTAVVLPNSVITLGERAFYSCFDLEEITLPNKLTTIPDSTFNGCSALKRIVIPSGVKTIGSEAFSSCAALQSVVIPASVEEIGYRAFGFSQNVTDVYFGGTKEAWKDLDVDCEADYIHYDVADPTGHWTSVVTPMTCTQDGITTHSCACAVPYTYTSDRIPAQHTYDDENDKICNVCNLWAEGKCGAEDDTVFWKLTGDGKLTIFGNGAMDDYTFSAGATTAPWFEYADEITEVFIDDGVTYIGACAFGRCKSITDVTIGADVETIGERAFYMTEGLKNVTIGADVETIGKSAFYWTKGLKNVTIPGTVKTIGNGAFRNSGLTSVTLQEGIEVIEEDAFRETMLTSVALPDSVTTLGAVAFSDCWSLTEVTLSAKLTTIPEFVFYGCSKLQSVTIPSGVKTIEDSAFCECTALQSIAIPASVEIIGYNSFSDCYNLTDVYFGGTQEAWEDMEVACGAKYVHYDVADPATHWTANIVNPTCTEDGYTSTVCSCGYEKDKKAGETKLDHEYGDDRTCIRCPARQPVNITKQPVSVKMCPGGSARVKVQAAGDGLTYQWYFKNASGSRFNLTTSYTTSTYSVVMNAERDGRQIYCVVTDRYGNSARSDVATLTMGQSLKITQQPVDTAAAGGQSLKLQVKAVGDGLTYQWYFKNSGATKFSKTDTFKGNTYWISSMSASRSGRQVYCVITDRYGNSVKSDVVTLRLSDLKLKITQQPVSVTVKNGKSARTLVVAEGERLQYQWYFKDTDDSKFKLTTSYTTDVYSVVMRAARDGRQIYCVITDAYGNSVTSKTVTLRMK